MDHSGWPTGKSFGTLTCAGIDPGGYLLLHLCHGPMDPASDAAPWTRRGCALCRLWPWPAEELILGHARRALFRRLSRRWQGGDGQQIPKWTHAWNRCRCGTIWKEWINRCRIKHKIYFIRKYRHINHRVIISHGYVLLMEVVRLIVINDGVIIPRLKFNYRMGGLVPRFKGISGLKLRWKNGDGPGILYPQLGNCIL